MGRVFALAAGAAVVAGVGGCASTWDDVTSRRFRDKPSAVLFKSDDPLHVLRSNPDGSERAKAMARLKEPLANGRPEAEQEEVFQLLADAATADPSPWVRMSAVNALGRFRDPRATDLLVAAYHQADGRPAQVQTPIQLTAGRGGEPGLLGDRLGLHGPQGFHSDQAGMLRGLALDNLARRDDPKVVDFLARVAAGEEAQVNEDPAVRDFVRQRAVASLGKVRTKEAVVALAKVLAADGGKDVTITHLAHGGLVGLTGQNHPPDPARWNEVIQAGFEIAPPPSGLQKTLQAVEPD